MVLNLAKCSQCGSGVPKDAHTLGLCPRCLLKSALVGSSNLGGRRMRNLDPPETAALDGVLGGLEVLELIGQGGMGFVYKARQRSLDRLVAVKLFPREAYTDPSFAERFANEARIMANLSHPHIVAAYEFGESNQYCHLVMELIRGQSLRQRLEEGKVPADEAIEIVRQVCDALDYAHGRGVIHRDIKPENILLEERPMGGGARVRVADFGLAKLVQRRPTDFSMTAPNRLMGTPDYMAPEQRQRPAEVDARADVYAIGVVLYEMLSGQLPLGRFAAPTGDARLNRIVLRCLETLPQDRYASAALVRRDLDRFTTRGAPPIWAMALVAAAILVGIVIPVLLSRFGAQRALESKTTGNVPSPVVTTNSAIAPRSRPATDVFRPGPPLPPEEREIWTLVTPGSFEPQGPMFDRMPQYASRQDFLDRMVREHGANRVVRVFVDDLPEGKRDAVLARLKTLSGATATFVGGSGASISIHLAPVRDVEALSKKIDFGKVTNVDLKNRTIEVMAGKEK